MWPLLVLVVKRRGVKAGGRSAAMRDDVRRCRPRQYVQDLAGLNAAPTGQLERSFALYSCLLAGPGRCTCVCMMAAATCAARGVLAKPGCGHCSRSESFWNPIMPDHQPPAKRRSVLGTLPALNRCIDDDISAIHRLLVSKCQPRHLWQLLNFS
jgi:hypothetical protein